MFNKLFVKLFICFLAFFFLKVRIKLVDLKIGKNILNKKVCFLLYYILIYN